MRKIFHPTDFTKGSAAAFQHALKIALMSEGVLNILHVDPPNTHRTWDQFPKVRETLCHWGLLPPGSSKDDLAKLKLGVRKSIATGQDTGRAMLRHLEKHHTDLMVVATYQRSGLARVFKPSVSSLVNRESGIPTLFVPTDTGFVDPKNGKCRLKRFLIPVDTFPDPDPAINAARALAKQLGSKKPRFTLMHIGEPNGPFPCLLPNEKGEIWEQVTRSGPVLETILKGIEDFKAQCLVMTTAGRKGLLESLMGSTSEKIIQQTTIPVLNINTAK